MSNIQNIIILSSVIFNKNEKRYESREISRSLDPLALEIRASRRTPPDTPNFRAARTLNDDMQILEQTSRRGSQLRVCSSLSQKLLPKLLFMLL